MRFVSQFARRCTVVVVCLVGGALAGCGQPGSGGGGGFGPIDNGSLGITAGGSQDIAAARALIEQGYLPYADSITVEGFFSEHEVPLPTPADAQELYVSGALAWRQAYAQPGPGVDVFIGFGTTIDIEHFDRPPLNLVVVVDRSGSMSESASPSDFRSKLEATQQALRSLVDRLNENDRIALVAFDDEVEIELPAAQRDQRDAARSKIDALTPDGGTDLNAALKAGYEQALKLADGTRANRVILLTDALPTSGNTDTPALVEMAQFYAEQGIGLTLMGVGFSYGEELVREISQVKNGNAFYLSDADRIAGIFEDEFEFLVTPIAERVRLDVTVADGVAIKAVYGVPDYIAGSNGARIEIPTLFFSRREGGGAIILRLAFADTPTFENPAPLGSLSLSYKLNDGTQREQSMDIALPAGLSPTGDPPYFSDPSAERAAALLDAIVVLIDAIDSADKGNFEAAAAMIETFLPLFDAETRGLSDRIDETSRSLSNERDLLEALLGTVN